MKNHSHKKPEQGLLKSGTQGKFPFALHLILVLGMLDDSTEESNTTDLTCTLSTDNPISFPYFIQKEIPLAPKKLYLVL